MVNLMAESHRSEAQSGGGARAAPVAPAWAASRTVTLSLPGMTCPACPITVNKALSKVEGVSEVDVANPGVGPGITFGEP